jgi:hypothetical protein
MSNELFCDNDIILKSCCYDLSCEVLIFLSTIGNVCVLGTAKFVVPSRIARSKLISNRTVAKDNFDLFIETVTLTEPTEAEIQLAAEFEAEAQKQNLSLDSGESILLAALLTRGMILLLTGDKRAISAIEPLKAVHAVAKQFGEQIACLEQLIAALLRTISISELRAKICREKLSDGALSNCFSCQSGSYTEKSVNDGLESHIEDVRKSAPSILIAQL